MKQITIGIIILTVLVSCSAQRQLSKAYIGRPVTVLTESFGKPLTIMEKDGEKVYIFEKEEKLKSTEINQGKLTLDPIITPKVTKTERYYFTVRNETIVSTRFEELYER